MSLKAKITWGFVAMLVLLVGLGGYAFDTVHQLDRNSRAILQDNFYSVQLGQRMLQALDELATPAAAPAALNRYSTALTREAGNITEPGEQQLVDSMVQTLGRYEDAPVTRAATVAELRRHTHHMVALNMAALTRKNEQANRTATAATRFLVTLLTLGALLALALVLSVPEAAVGGLRKLTASIDHAAAGNFSASIPQESTDEFGSVTRAFNGLLMHLNEYRTANLAELLTERNRVASIVQTLKEGLLLLDESRQVIVANPVACALLGLSEAEVVARPAEELAQANPVFGQLLAYVQQPAAQRGSTPLALTVGEGAEAVFYQVGLHEAVSFNAATDRMEFIGSILALHNVSAFKKLDQTKSDFLATISHELKTPLSSSNFNLKLLLDQRIGPLNAEQADIVSSLRQENQRLLLLVSELLTVARLEAGATIALDMRPTALAALVAAATEPLQLQLRPKHLVLDVQLPPNLPPVRADLEKSAWVLLNLLANAVRYSPEGGRIIVSAAAEPDGQAVRVQVQDDGPGIAPEHQQRIFERFAQGPGAGPEAAAGTGLGLSISREFITNQGGTLGVESTPGAGSTFYFTLPVA
ncbi:HAMP domain-containing sensor histidine kinase [Hymenobacter siberiensis]|uniref:HAMP domain-containing sensor histidine kinase n=1 Tax=Hymenobacter siberiensis TaxID=2848396 RepID=UPI001C1E87A4|nr:ATP-binding protein [Hymenobacter siberiensis]MBU6123337.1 HAMP domain-containing protein [Hymenobacter siberiensis]